MRLFHQVIFFFVFTTFLSMSIGVAQNDDGTLVSKKMYNRTLNALQNYVKDEISYFEGFMLCSRYPEKMKLLKNIDQTVAIVDTFSNKRNFKDDPQINNWKSQAHFLYGIALGLLGEKTTADFELGLAQKYFLGDTSAWNQFMNREIEIGQVKDKLSKFEEIYLTHIDDLAPVQIVIDEKKYVEVGSAIAIKQVKLGSVSHPKLVPHVLAYAEGKITKALLRGANAALVYLPTGKFQIHNINKAKLLGEFRVKDVMHEKSVKIPQTKSRFGFYFLILGSAIAAALGT